MLKFKIKFNIFTMLLTQQRFFIYFIFIIHKNNISKLVNNLNKIEIILKKTGLKSITKISLLYIHFLN